VPAAIELVPYSRRSDEWLLNRARSSRRYRQRAEAELVSRYVVVIDTMLEALLWDLPKADREDAAEAAKVALLETDIRGSKPLDPFRRYVYARCDYAARDARRLRARRAKRESLVDAPELSYSSGGTRAGPGDTRTALHASEAPDLESNFSDWISGLGEPDETVLRMTYVDDKPSSEIAEAVGLSPANVDVRRARALKRLRERWSA
jgi:RNA polymerase sigma factor (sigma-70 family)